MVVLTPCRNGEVMADSTGTVCRIPAGHHPVTFFAPLVRLRSAASVRNERARAFYEAEALHGGWTVRQLDRQINTQSYEPTPLSRNKAALLAEGGKVGSGDSFLSLDPVPRQKLGPKPALQALTGDRVRNPG